MYNSSLLVIWKISVLLALGIGNFIIGVIPAYYFNRNNNKKQNFLVSGLLCFGTGVLLVESRYLGESVMEETGYVISAGSFFLLYFANELYNYRRKTSSSNQDSHIYSRSLIRPDEILPVKQELESNIPNALSSSLTGKERVHQHDALSAASEQYRDGDELFLGHKTILKSNANYYVSHFGVVLALMIDAGNNAAYMGDMPFDPLRFVMPAIFLRQFILALWLGLELSEAYGHSPKHIFAIFLYSGASCLGLALGMFVSDFQRTVVDPSHYFAKGIITYVALTEILPRERTRCYNSPMRLSGLMQFFSVFSGYTFMKLAYEYIH